jgi:2-polyprenyl-3-methyl-5-hydroxy-6-metoxy-1,4-benzoquinol methylase
MPLPIYGFQQHYDEPPEEYFKNHEPEIKELGATALLRRAEELTGGKGRLLDVGSGRGEFLRAALSGGWEPIGIEPSQSFAKHAEAYSGAVVRREPIEDCNFEDEQFDVVILSAVLEHLYDPDGTVREISRVLRPGGTLFLDVPNEEGLYFRIGNLYERLRRRDWVVNTAPTFPPFHVFGFGTRSLRKLLQRHNLRPADWRVYGGQSMVPAGGTSVGTLERLGARAVTAASNFHELGTYIETWAIKGKTMVNQRTVK